MVACVGLVAVTWRWYQAVHQAGCSAGAVGTPGANAWPRWCYLWSNHWSSQLCALSQKCPQCAAVALPLRCWLCASQAAPCRPAVMCRHQGDARTAAQQCQGQIASSSVQHLPMVGIDGSGWAWAQAQAHVCNVCRCRSACHHQGATNGMAPLMFGIPPTSHPPTHRLLLPGMCWLSSRVGSPLSLLPA